MGELKRLYNENTSFKQYVDKYTKCFRTSCSTVEDALEHDLVKEVAAYYKEGDANEQSPKASTGTS